MSHYVPTDIESCSEVENPCVNGACVDVDDGFVCECNVGFTGVYCEEGMYMYSVLPLPLGPSALIKFRIEYMFTVMSSISRM